jgi:hypothetical protein
LGTESVEERADRVDPVEEQEHRTQTDRAEHFGGNAQDYHNLEDAATDHVCQGA